MVVIKQRFNSLWPRKRHVASGTLDPLSRIIDTSIFSKLEIAKPQTAGSIKSLFSKRMKEREREQEEERNLESDQ